MKKLVDAIRNLVIGLFTTGKHLGRHAVTLQYPTEKWKMPERSRGIVVLLSDKETGELNCTVCMLCARACPSGAIKIEQHRDEETKKRVLDSFVVDNTICCFCGLCEESCNFAAIKMATKYEFSTVNKEELIWHADRLQEIGRDVPYEKPVKKKKAAAKPAAKPSPEAPVKEMERPDAAPAGEPEEQSQSTEPTDPQPEKKDSGAQNNGNAEEHE